VSVNLIGVICSLKGTRLAGDLGSLRVYVDFDRATVDYRAPIRLSPYISYRAPARAPLYL
jgi:hypothetical protein